MAETLASVFARVAKDTPIDAALLHRIHTYERAFVNRSEEHVQFFGGNLMGVHPLRFRNADRDDWFADVLRIDELELREGLGHISAIKKEWKRASDAMNHSCVWLLHAIYISNLSTEQKHAGMVDTMLILQYKFLASLMAHYYRYPADRETMEAAYASLNYRYALKVAGSWAALMRQRAEEIISPSGVHKLTYQRFNDDVKIINMINDIQGRLRKIVKSLTEVFYNIRAQGGRIGTSREIMEIDGQNVVQDKTRNFTSFVRYIHSVADDPRSFIRPELIEIITDAQHTLRQGPPDQLKEALEWMCINHRERFPRWSPKVDGAYVEEFMQEVLLHAFSLISHKNALTTVRQGLGPLLEQLRALYMASRMNDPALLKTKEMANHIVAASISSRNESVAAAVRTAIQLYVVLRAMTMHHYQSK